MEFSVISLNVLILVLLVGAVWFMGLKYSRSFSRIDEELQAINMMLSEMPKEASLKEYMFAQDQRLRGLGERLDAHPDAELLKQSFQDQANQIIAILATQDDSNRFRITRTELETLFRITNDLLEKVLWSLRFDEDKYVGSGDPKRNVYGDLGDKDNGCIDTQLADVREESDENNLMSSILEQTDDNYSALIKYMQMSGKGGTDALRALHSAKGT